MSKKKRTARHISTPKASVPIPTPTLQLAQSQPPSGLAVASRPRNVDLVILLALFLITRLINLSTFPLHGDEGAYIYWGQIAASGPDQRFISMWGGRQPLHTWIVAALVPVVDDILVPARLISVAAGALTALAVFLLARRLFSTRVAVIATLFYILSPYAAQFDRQVFQDGMIAAEATWTLYLTVVTFERPRWPATIGLGVVVGLALLTKSTSWLFIPLTIFGFLPFPPSEWKRRAIRAALHLAVALVIGGGLYYVLFGSSPAASELGRWASTFSYSIGELLGFPFDAWGNNLGVIARWLATYLTLPVFLAALAAHTAAIVWLARPDDQADRPARTLGRKMLLLAIWGLTPVLAHVVLARSLYARYIVFAVPPFLILIAALADRVALALSRRPALMRFSPSIVTAVLVALLVALPAYQTALLVFAPQNFNFDVADRDPYYDRALWARLPLTAYIRDTADGRPTTLLTNYGMNNVLMGQMVTLPRDEASIRLSPLWPVNDGKLYPFDPRTLQPLAPAAIQAIGQTRVLYGTLPGEEGPMAQFVAPLAEFDDRTGQTQVRLYAVDFDRFLAWLSQ